MDECIYRVLEIEYGIFRQKSLFIPQIMIKIHKFSIYIPYLVISNSELYIKVFLFSKYKNNKL